MEVIGRAMNTYYVTLLLIRVLTWSMKVVFQVKEHKEKIRARFVRCNPQPIGWLKWNTDASRVEVTQSTTIGIIADITTEDCCIVLEN